MSHFYGTVEGARGPASRTGSKESGITTYAAGWSGAIRVDVYEEDGEDRFRVSLVPWQYSGGDSQLLSEGVLDARVMNREAFIRKYGSLAPSYADIAVSS